MKHEEREGTLQLLYCIANCSLIRKYSDGRPQSYCPVYEKKPGLIKKYLTKQSLFFDNFDLADELIHHEELQLSCIDFQEMRTKVTDQTGFKIYMYLHKIVSVQYFVSPLLTDTKCGQYTYRLLLLILRSWGQTVLVIRKCCIPKNTLHYTQFLE